MLRFDLTESHTMPDEYHLSATDFNTFKSVLYCTSEDLRSLRRQITLVLGSVEPPA